MDAPQKTITESQRLELLGLPDCGAAGNVARVGRIVARVGRIVARVGRIVAAAREITGEEDPSGHCADAVYGGRDPQDALLELLCKLGIVVT
ncbi:MAG: hypothetical protein ABSE45_14925 [Candidatus Acidiferrales bacterium]|jgi:hypothetical protein